MAGNATAQHPSLLSFSTSLFRRKPFLLRSRNFPAPIAREPRTASYSRNLLPWPAKISLPNREIQGIPEAHMAGAAAGHGLYSVWSGSDRVVHLKLDRMRRVLEIVHLFPFQLDIRLDEVAAEHVAL